jgi:hypothetical protein
MAITRAQQAKQMLRKGGRIGLKGGADASMADFDASANPDRPGGPIGRTGPGPAVGAGGASFNPKDNFQTLSSMDEGVRRRNELALENAAYKKGVEDLTKLYDEGVPDLNMPGLLGLGLKGTKKLRDFTLRKNIEYFQGLNTSKYPKTEEGYRQYMQDRLAGEIDAAGNTIMTGGDDPFIPMNQMSTNMDQASAEEVLSPIQQAILDRGDASAFLATGGRVGLKGGADASQFNKSPSEQKSVNVSGGGATLGSEPPEGPDDRASADQDMVQMLVRQGYTPKEIRKITEGPTVIDRIKESPLNNPLTRGIVRTGLYTLNPTLGPVDFRKAMQLKGVYDTTMENIYGDVNEEDMQLGGGPVGGIMDLESGRQMYFLGKLVKKATRAVKKIAKSPIGKAALAFGAYKLGKMPFGTTKTSLFDRFLGTNIGSSMGDFFSEMETKDKFKLGIGGALTLAPLLFQQEEEEQPDFASSAGPGLPASIPDIRKNYRDYLARAFVADGGTPEPVAKKTMPLLDMDGKEMDLRAEGGFVPIGRMEKADDVPARLSKNEFVFTADAVRNAGDGNVDKGAEVMYNMMKNLESGGDVSEESQGLEGAREMFQTSQRLEEVL